LQAPSGILMSDRWVARMRFDVEKRRLCHGHLRPRLSSGDRGGPARPKGQWLLDESDRMLQTLRVQTLRCLQARPGGPGCTGGGHEADSGGVERRARSGHQEPGSEVGHTRPETSQDHWDALRAFVNVEGAEPTNNEARRTLRPAVIFRKCCFGTKSGAGSLFVVRKLTVIETARRRGVHVLDLLLARVPRRHPRYRPAAAPVQVNQPARRAPNRYLTATPTGDIFSSVVREPSRGPVGTRRMAAGEGYSMALETALGDIIARLRQGRYPNEQAISQGIVLRVLQELGWDTWDPAVVWPEYQTGEGRADFALCHPPRRPAIFIEVKQPGSAEGGVRQVLEYAFHTGVPFVVLTDGRTWGFYLPAEQGTYEDRRVHLLDLYERTPAEAAEIFVRYLDRERVQSGEALETARQEYRSHSRRSQARAAIPEAWDELVRTGDEDLVQLLARGVETRIGVRPHDDDVADFLHRGLRRVVVETPITNAPVRTDIRPGGTGSDEHVPPIEIPPPPRRGRLTLRGRVYEYQNAKEAMIIVLRELANEDPTFLERCYQHPKSQGRKRRYIARTLEELYPDREDLRVNHEPLPRGWFVSTNLNNMLKKTIIELAAEVAGLVLGRDLIVDL